MENEKATPNVKVRTGEEWEEFFKELKDVLEIEFSNVQVMTYYFVSREIGKGETAEFMDMILNDALKIAKENIYNQLKYGKGTN